jgi:hypothetical protein
MAFFGLSLFFALSQDTLLNTVEPKVAAYPLDVIEVSPAPAVEAIPDQATDIELIPNSTEVATPSGVMASEQIQPQKTSNQAIVAEQRETQNSTTSFAQPTAVANSAFADKQAPEVAKAEQPSNVDQVNIAALPYLNLAGIPSVNLNAREPNDFKQQKPKYTAKWAYPFIRIAGVSSSVNFQNTGGYGFSAAAGLEKPIGNGFSISAALAYTQRNKPGIGTVNDSVFYGFSAERIVNEEELLRTHHVELPLLFNYNLGSRHKLGLGLTARYMVAAEASITRQQTKFDRLFHRKESSEKAQMALKSFDVALHAQYRYLVASRISVGTSLQYGFSDFAIDIDDSQRLTDVRLFLQYAL